MPVSALRWRIIDDFVLNTPLGVDECTVEILDSEKYRALKPGEAERISRAQARLFCDWVLETQGVVLGNQLKYLLDIFGLTRAKLANAMQISPSAITQLIKGQTSPSKQTARQLAVFLRIEADSPGFILSLAGGKWPAGVICPLKPSPSAAIAASQP